MNIGHVGTIVSQVHNSVRVHVRWDIFHAEVKTVGQTPLIIRMIIGHVGTNAFTVHNSVRVHVRRDIFHVEKKIVGQTPLIIKVNM